MLQRIWVRNFALIHELNLEFKSGFTAISGETGSGKSIFLGALNLILGERAEFSLIGPKGDKAVVEAEFAGVSKVISWFAENDVDQESSILVRREIATNGRSRAFVNDTPVSLLQLKALTSELVSIHSQYDTLALKDRNYHQEIFDLLCGTNEDLVTWQKLFHDWKSLKKQLNALIEANDKELAEKDYVAFQLDELSLLNLDSIDVAQIEADLLSLENAEELQLTYTALGDGLTIENGVLEQLNGMKARLDKNANLHPAMKELSTRLNSALIELKDIHSEAVGLHDSIEKNPERLLELTDFMNQFNRMLTKHRVATQEDLLELKKLWEEKLAVSDANSETIDRLYAELKGKHSFLVTSADHLHQKRLEGAQGVKNKIENVLKELNMADFKVEFELTKTEELSENGSTSLRFMVQPNKGHAWQTLEKSASGGELSRLMLSLQYLISDKKQLPTVLFDEIDTGISGEIAQKMGILLKKMGTNFQLITISHLPQVIGKADQHIKVEKQLTEGITMTLMSYLNETDRVAEVARLISGSEITTSSLESAKSLMTN